MNKKELEVWVEWGNWALPLRIEIGRLFWEVQIGPLVIMWG